jgi:hypothetical protein
VDEILAVPQAVIYANKPGLVLFELLGLFTGPFGILIMYLKPEWYSVRAAQAREMDIEMGKSLLAMCAAGTRAASRKFLGINASYIMLTIALPAIGFGELFLLQGGGVPKGEEYYSVGQWAPLVSAIFVIIAAILDRLHGCFVLSHVPPENDGSREPTSHECILSRTGPTIYGVENGGIRSTRMTSDLRSSSSSS